MQIVDYEPRTSQATPLAGNVSVEQQQETSKSLGASLSGGFQPFAQGTAGTDLAEKSTSQIRYELKPPMEVILVAGTVQRGTGVYFKLLPSAESAWEGSREFVIVMRVSRDWRGDIMYVRCEAQQDQHGRVASRGVSRFVVGIARRRGRRSACGCRESESRRTGPAPHRGPAATRYRATIDADRRPSRGSIAGYVRSADSRHVARSIGLRVRRTSSNTTSWTTCPTTCVAWRIATRTPNVACTTTAGNAWRSTTTVWSWAPGEGK